MATIGKLNRPKIYTESDQILSELSDELSDLRSRMNLLEEDQEQSRALLDELSLQKELSNRMILNQQEEINQNREGFTVIANVMQNLKSPITSVVDNLADIISEIDDEETQDSLRECMNTASSVLTSFDEVESFCIDAGGDPSSNPEMIEIRDFFRDRISRIQSEANFKEKHTLRLLVDKNVPGEAPIYTEAIDEALSSLIKELQKNPTSNKFTVIISSENNEQKYGIEISDLTIQIKAEEPTVLEWTDSWVESIKQNQSLLLNSGFNLLRARDFLRKTGGNLEVLKEEQKVNGFKISIPLTY